MANISKVITAIGKRQVDVISNELPELKPTQVKVKSIVSGVSAGTERKTLRGEIPSFHKHWDKEFRIYKNVGKKKRFPVGMGYKIIGEVIEVGRKAKGFVKGVVVWIDSPHADYTIVEAEKIYKNTLPKDMDPYKAVFIIPTRVALGAVHDAKIKVGDNVAVVGLGVIGNLAAQIAKLSGANVIGLDSNMDKVQIAKKLGINAFQNKNEDWGELIRRKYFTQGADSVIEASGTYGGLSEAISLCGMEGRVVTVGSYPTEKTVMNLGEEWQKNKITMVSSMTVNDCTHPDYPLWDFDRLNKTAASLLYANKIQVLSLISHKYNFTHAKRAYTKLLKDNSVMEIVFEYNK